MAFNHIDKSLQKEPSFVLELLKVSNINFRHIHISFQSDKNFVENVKKINPRVIKKWEESERRMIREFGFITSMRSIK